MAHSQKPYYSLTNIFLLMLKILLPWSFVDAILTYCIWLKPYIQACYRLNDIQIEYSRIPLEDYHILQTFWWFRQARSAFIGQPTHHFRFCLERNDFWEQEVLPDARQVMRTPAKNLVTKRLNTLFVGMMPLPELVIYRGWWQKFWWFKYSLL